MKRLNKLIKCNYDIFIYGIKTNSLEVRRGDLFVATRGMNIDHHDYIMDAIRRGAVAVISEKNINTDIPVVIVKNTNKALRKILKKFYENIEKEFFFIGVTGTDGKTTTSTVISKVLKSANIGTNGITYRRFHKSLNNTTPSIEDLSNYFSKLNQLGCKYISMEASSEALLHERLNNVKYNVGILTNITEDHLNIHKNIKNYVESKGLLFKKINKSGFAVLNRDDKYYLDILSKCNCKVFTYGFDVNSDFVICKYSDNKFSVLHNNRMYILNLNFNEIYNIYNFTAAFVCLYVMGLDSNYILDEFSKIKNIPGRGEKLNFGQDYQIILDYAHTLNAISNILSTYVVNKKNRIITVTGSAGGREKEKRRKIGKVVTDLSDIVIFTEDDPRCEKVLDIINDMTQDVKKKNYYIYEKREEAISYALSIAKKDDIVLILGKGRDNYMAVGNKKIKYCDYDVIRSYFK